jgi:small conductance mechanosensitive channel
MIEWIKSNLNPESLATLTPVVIQYGTKLLGAIILLIIVLMVSGWVRSLVEKSLKKVNFDDTLSKFISSLSRWIVLLLGIVACLGIFGVDTTSVAGVLAGASLAIGLAFKVGQVISVAGHTGGVEEISLFTTTMNTPDNKHIIIPNGQVFGATITNLSHNDLRRVDVNIGVDYSADIDRTREVLVKAAEGTTSRADGEPITAFLAEYAGSSVNWQVRVMAENAKYWDVHQEVMRAVKIALDEEGIDIPFDQIVVHRADAGGE